jgi:oligopeptide transport system permease protein
VIRYVAGRVLAGIPVLWVVATLTFALLRFLPGGPFDKERALPPEILHNLERRYALDGTLAEQYVDYLGRIVRGDLGPSYKYPGRDVADILADALPVSLELGLVALALAMAGGIALGLAAGVRRDTPLDRAIALASLAGVSAPSFVVGAALILGVGLGLGWLPAGLWEGPTYVVLPALTLAALPLAYIAQLTRVQVLAVLDLDYVRTARAKGVSEWLVVCHHALVNAALPLVTVAGLQFGLLLGGAVITETVFAVPGVGRLIVGAIRQLDFPIVQAGVFLLALIVVFVNFAVDMLYIYLNPQIRVR